MQQARETEQHSVILQKIPAGKRGFFHAGNHKTAPEAACCRRVGLPGGGTEHTAEGVFRCLRGQLVGQVRDLVAQIVHVYALKGCKNVNTDIPVE